MAGVPPLSGASGRLRAIQYLRAVAALSVTCHHALGKAFEGGPAPVLTGGVDIFFVISGMVTWAAIARRAPSPGTFLRRRLLRIVPLYWVVTSMMAVLLLVAPGLMHTARFVPAHVVASYLFIPWPHPPPETGIYPLLVPGWTLNYEMFFTFLLAVALALPARARAAMVLGGFVALAAIGTGWSGLPTIPRFYTAPIVLEFALGIAIAMLPAHRPAPWLGAGLALVGIVALAASSQADWSGADRLLRLGLPAALIVLGVTLWERARPVPTLRLGLLLGNASYANYLTHTIVLAALAVAWNRAGLAGHPAAFVLVGLLASASFAVGLHLLVERRLNGWLLR